MKTHNRILRVLLVMFLATAAVLSADAKKSPKRVKYVFFMIGDGMGINQVYSTNLYNSALGITDQPVNFSAFPVKSIVTTHCTNTLVTDSAAGGTALATGTKTTEGTIGLDADGKPLQTLCEAAKAAGYGAGVVSSVSVDHATPSAFYAHTTYRYNYNDISSQLIKSDIDFAAGGGFDYEGDKPYRTADFISEARNAGIGVYLGKEQIEGGIDHSRRAILLGSTEINELPLAIDRTDDWASLSDFTSAAIEHLYANYKNGFFLMVEGGRIDHAAHNDDAASNFREINDFAESVELVLEFCRNHPDESVVLVTSDHDTGGLMMGSGRYEIHPELLAGQTCSKNQLTATIEALKNSGREVSWEEIKSLLQTSLGLWSVVPVDEKQEARFKKLYEDVFVTRDGEQEVNWYAANSMLVAEAVTYLDRAAGFAYSFSAHSGSPVGLYVSGARAAEFGTCGDNTDISKVVRRIANY